MIGPALYCHVPVTVVARCLEGRLASSNKEVMEVLTLLFYDTELSR